MKKEKQNVKEGKECKKEEICLLINILLLNKHEEGFFMFIVMFFFVLHKNKQTQIKQIISMYLNGKKRY